MNTAFISPGGNLVYVLVDMREQFDWLKLPATDHGDHGDKGHLLSKSIEAGDIYIVFQHWLTSPKTKAVA